MDIVRLVAELQHASHASMLGVCSLPAVSEAHLGLECQCPPGLLHAVLRRDVPAPQLYLSCRGSEMRRCGDLASASLSEGLSEGAESPNSQLS